MQVPEHFEFAGVARSFKNNFVCGLWSQKGWTALALLKSIANHILQNYSKSNFCVKYHSMVAEALKLMFKCNRDTPV